MGRPSKVEEKREIILDAFEKIILRDGFGQASQRKIAEEAGINQPMIHHYFGGGEAMFDALLKRVVDRYSNALTNFASSTVELSLEKILGFACSEEFHQVSQQNKVFFSCIIGEGDKDQRISDKVSLVYTRFLSLITTHLEKSKVKNSEQMGYLLMCLILGHDWARKFGFGEQRNQDMVNHLTKLVEL